MQFAGLWLRQRDLKRVCRIFVCLLSKRFKANYCLENIRDVGANGLYIELKRKQVLTEGKRKALIQSRPSGRASTEQEDWQAFLRQQGYVCEICYGFEEARNLILSYLREGGLI
jgi:hypothetical protein